MAKWMLRTGALAALGLVMAMVVLSTRGHPLATLPHAGGALALDFLQVLAVLVALLALFISSTVRTLNRKANIALDAETVAHEYNELIASARDVVREIEKKRPATFSDLTAQVDTIDRLVDSEDASRFERRPWSPLRWEGTIYLGAVLLFFITWIAFVEAELLPRGDSPTLVMVDLSQAAIFIVAWVLVAILGAQVFVQVAQKREIEIVQIRRNIALIRTEWVNLKRHLENLTKPR